MPGEWRSNSFFRYNLRVFLNFEQAKTKQIELRRNDALYFIYCEEMFRMSDMQRAFD